MTLGVVAAYSFVPAFVLSLLLPIGVKPLLVRLGIMDVPNERSSHERPVLRGLGLAVLIALVTVELGLVLAISGIAPEQSDWRYLLVILLASLAAGLLGLSEDLAGISVPVRSGVLIAIGLSASLALLWIARTLPVNLPVGGLDVPGLPLIALAGLAVYGVLFISSYINVANFMDGLNGISGMHGIVAGLAFAASGIWVGAGWLTVAGWVLAAAFAGFLPWNLSRPGAFLGDVGSYLLGGAVAVTSFAAFLSGVPVLATIGPMIIYFGDVGTTLVKRVRAGHHWDEPHKEHAYQRLQQLGMPHVAASGITAAFTLVASALGLLSLWVAPIWWWALTAAGIALVVLYECLPRLLARRSDGVAPEVGDERGV